MTAIAVWQIFIRRQSRSLSFCVFNFSVSDACYVDLWRHDESGVLAISILFFLLFSLG